MPIRSPFERCYRATSLALARGARWPVLMLTLGPSMLSLAALAAIGDVRLFLVAVGGVFACFGMGAAVTFVWRGRLSRRPASPASVAWALAREQDAVAARVSTRALARCPAAAAFTLPMLCEWIDEARGALLSPATGTANRRDQDAVFERAIGAR